jgi:hypothetical protein
MVALAVYATIVFIGLRLSRQRLALPLMIGAAGVVFVPTAIWGITSGVFAFWHFLAFFACGVAAVVFLYGAVLKSLSLQMLAMLARTPGHTLTTQHLATAVIRTAFADRIQLLDDARLIERVDNGYMLTAPGISTVARIRRLQRSCRVDSSPLYSN